LLESGEARDGRSQSMFNEDVSIEKGDMALLLIVVGVVHSVLIWPMPSVKAKLVHDVGGNGVAGAASFSINENKNIPFILRQLWQII